MPCWTWTPATGPVEHYAVVVSYNGNWRTEYTASDETHWCENPGPGDTVVIQVQAIGPGPSFGTPSLVSEVLVMPTQPHVPPGAVPEASGGLMLGAGLLLLGALAMWREM